MSDKPRIKLEYIEARNPESVIGRVVWEHDFHMLIDALGYVPSIGEEVKPPGRRTLYRVVKVRREYLAKKIKLKVIVVKARR